MEHTKLLEDADDKPNSKEYQESSKKPDKISIPFHPKNVFSFFWEMCKTYQPDIVHPYMTQIHE